MHLSKSESEGDGRAVKKKKNQDYFAKPKIVKAYSKND